MNGEVRNLIVSGSGHVVASDGSAASGLGGASAVGGSAAAAQGSTAHVVRPSAIARLAKRAATSRWVKVSGVVALMATAAATALVALNVTGIAIAGLILAVIAVVVGVVPMLRNGELGFVDLGPIPRKL